MCRDYIKENGRSWKTDQRKRNLENESHNQKMLRLEKVSEKKEKIREKTLQKRLLENWLILPEKEKNKYRRYGGRERIHNEKKKRDNERIVEKKRDEEIKRERLERKKRMEEK